VTIELTAEVVMGISSAEASLRFTLGDLFHNWQQAWKDAQRELRHLTEPQNDPLNDDTICTAARRLRLFYVQTYHIKDALKNAVATTGITPKEVEDAVSADPALPLLADLANLVKHGALIKPPRSGHVPSIQTAVTGEPVNQPPGTWRLRLTIDHAGRTLDGIEVAQNAVEAWGRTLSNWGLI